jgi:hypothetical protein
MLETLDAGRGPQASTCVLLLSHIVNDLVLARYHELSSALSPRFDVTLLLTEQAAAPARGIDAVSVGPEEIFLPEFGEKSSSGKIVPGNTELTMLAFRRKRPGYRHIWLIEYDVLFAGGADLLATLDAASGADLIVPKPPHTRAVLPEWSWWHTLHPATTVHSLTPDTMIRALICISRYSSRLLDVVDKAYRDGWNGHQEATVPTIALHAGLEIEHINAIAVRTGRKAALSNKSFDWQKCGPDDPQFIYHPVKTLAAEARLRMLLNVRAGWQRFVRGGAGLL